jgi:hypothetical protein
MKKLIWKELMEMRWIPLGYAALAVVILVNWVVLDRSQFPSEHHTEAVSFVFLSAILFAGLFPGSAAIAPEVGRNTMQLIDNFPTGRGMVWCAKTISGLIIIAFSVALTAFGLIFVSVILFGSLPLNTLLPDPATTYHNVGVDLWESNNTINLWKLISCLLLVYALSMMVTTLVHSSVNATMISLIGGFLLFAGASGLVDWVGTKTGIQNDITITLAIYALTILALLTSSYCIFCRGGSLRSFKRFGIAGVFLVGLAALIGGGSVAYARINAIKPVVFNDGPGTELVKPDFLGLGDVVVGERILRTAYLTHPAVLGKISIKTSSKYLKVISVQKYAGQHYKLISVTNDQGYMCPTYETEGDHRDSCYQVTFEYAPTSPTGKEKQYITLLNSRGHTIGSVLLVMNTVEKSNWHDLKTLATYRYGQVNSDQLYRKDETLPLRISGNVNCVAFGTRTEMGFTHVSAIQPNGASPTLSFVYAPNRGPGFDQNFIAIYRDRGQPIGKEVVLAHKYLKNPQLPVKTIETVDAGNIPENTNTGILIPLTKDCDKLNCHYGSWDEPDLFWALQSVDKSTKHPYGALMCYYRAINGIGPHQLAINLWNDKRQIVGRILVNATEVKEAHP